MYLFRYENLILVAGGIGISPFFAILSDILHRINEGKPCLPKNVLIVWAVKQSDELPLLETVGMESICPNFSESLNLEIQTYVTRQSQPSLVSDFLPLYHFPLLEMKNLYFSRTKRVKNLECRKKAGHQ